MNSLTISAVALAGGLAAACVIAPEPARLSPDVTSPAPENRPATTTKEPVLYARDGRPVAPAGAALTTRETPPGIPAHRVQDGENSRMYLLELYQEAIDTKEALELDVRSLTAELQHVREQAATLETELSTTREEVARLELERDQQREELRTLAQRLVTAQIRRLESDKLLLQAKIEWARTREVIESTARGEQAAGPRDGGGPR